MKRCGYELLLPMGKLMAEWTGLEPATPGVTGRDSNQLNYHSTDRLVSLLRVPACLHCGWLLRETGAGEESRTLDLYLGKVSLYQLSYSRVKSVWLLDLGSNQGPTD